MSPDASSGQARPAARSPDDRPGPVDARGSRAVERSRPQGQAARHLSRDQLVADAGRESPASPWAYALGVRRATAWPSSATRRPNGSTPISPRNASAPSATAFIPPARAKKSEYVLRHGGASVLIAEDQEHVDKVLPLLERLPDLRRIVVIDDSNMFGYGNPALMSLADLIELGDSQGERLSPICARRAPGRPRHHRLHVRHQRASEGRRLYAPRTDHPGPPVLRFPELATRLRYPQRRASAAQSSLRADEHAAWACW